MSIADDFMFCKIMQDEGIYKEFLEMVLTDNIGKIAYLSPQNTIAAGIGAKSVRRDILVKDETGKLYDIEIQVANEHNIQKRMRYYQVAIDIAFSDKGSHYKALNDSYIDWRLTNLQFFLTGVFPFIIKLCHLHRIFDRVESSPDNFFHFFPFQFCRINPVQLFLFQRSKE